MVGNDPSVFGSPRTRMPRAGGWRFIREEAFAGAPGDSVRAVWEATSLVIFPSLLRWPPGLGASAGLRVDCLALVDD